MAWNEPGNNKDPWNNKGGKDQGPPDIDEIFKDFFGKFSKKGGSDNRSGGGGISSIGMMMVLIVAIIVWALSGFYTIREAERGVVLRFGEYHETVQPGLRWKMTFVDHVIPVDVQSILSLAAKGFMLTQDENVIEVQMEIQYRVSDPYLYKFSVTNADQSLAQALDSALRYVVGHSKMDDVLTSGRERVRQDTWQEVNKIIESYNMGLTILDVNFKDARPPEDVKDAFDDAIAAQEDEEKFIRQAEAYAREREPRARGQVQQMLQEAKAYKEKVNLNAQGEVARFEKLLPEYTAAPEVTRQRLYLETMEKVYGNTSKVMVDVEGGGNMMYLPLDQIMKNQGTLMPRNFGDLTPPLEDTPMTNRGDSQRPQSSGRSTGRSRGRN